MLLRYVDDMDHVDLVITTEALNRIEFSYIMVNRKKKCIVFKLHEAILNVYKFT